MIEELEDRRLLSTTGFDNFVLDDTFNQFTGGSPTVFGFGVTDNSADNDFGKGPVSPDPRFYGLSVQNSSVDLGGFTSTSFGPFGTATEGAELSGTFSFKLGINVGFYVNSGTASLLHDGTFSYAVEPPTSSDGPITITTGIDVHNGGVYTQSPEISAYADLVLDFSFVGSFQYEFDPITSYHSDPINVGFDETFPLASINRQETNDDGSPMTNDDGTPVFDGTVEAVGYDIFKSVKDVTKAIQEATEKGEEGVADEAKASMEEDEATTPAEKSAAESDMTEAKSEESDGEQAKKSADAESGSGGEPDLWRPSNGLVLAPRTAVSWDSRRPSTREFAAGEASVGEKLGDIAITLPDISLSGKQDPTTGQITASTDSITPGSDDDTKRQILAVTVNPTAIIPVLGEWDASIPGVDVSGSLLTYDITTAINVNQTVQATPAANENQVTFHFTDPNNDNAPVMVTPTVNGVAQPTSSSVTFTPGDTLTIQPPPGFTDPIAVTPSLTQSFKFSNTIGLDLEILGDLQVLQGDITLLGVELGPFGPLYDPGNDVLLSPQDLGTVYSNTFNITTPATDADTFRYRHSLCATWKSPW